LPPPDVETNPEILKKLISAARAWYNKDINETLFSQPYSRTKTIADLVGKKLRTTIGKYMDELVAARILSPKKDGNQVYYLK